MRFMVWVVVGGTAVGAFLPWRGVAAPGATERVSVASDGTEANGQSASPSISGDGRFVAFVSIASNLVPGDTNNAADVFVHDRQTRETRRVSVSSGGAQADAGSWLAALVHTAISGDGRYVAFNSLATNLVPGDDNRSIDVFVHDLETGETTLASVDADGSQSSGESLLLDISADGRFVLFVQGGTYIMIRDRFSGKTERVGRGGASSLSADGRYLVQATNGILIRDRKAGTSIRLAMPDLFNPWPSISADGRFVAFESRDPTRVPGDTPDTADVFLYDRESQRTVLVSANQDGVPTGGTLPRISVNGKYVLYIAQGLHLYDREAQVNTKLDVEASVPAIVIAPQDISDDGRFIAFSSETSSLVADDTNGVADIFVHDRLAPALPPGGSAPPSGLSQGGSRALLVVGLIAAVIGGLAALLSIRQRSA